MLPRPEDGPQYPQLYESSSPGPVLVVRGGVGSGRRMVLLRAQEQRVRSGGMMAEEENEIVGDGGGGCRCLRQLDCHWTVRLLFFWLRCHLPLYFLCLIETLDRNDSHTIVFFLCFPCAVRVCTLFCSMTFPHPTHVQEGPALDCLVLGWCIRPLGLSHFPLWYRHASGQLQPTRDTVLHSPYPVDGPHLQHRIVVVSPL